MRSGASVSAAARQWPIVRAASIAALVSRFEWSRASSRLRPGSGARSSENCLNFPLPPGTEETDYLKVLYQALERVSGFRPQLVAVSAGFDTYQDDPLAGLRLEIGTYGKIGHKIAGLGIPRFAVLEGGYSEDLPACIESSLRGFFES